ncbi:restriction endonuclease subunit S [Arenibacter sp. N53]|uniref:restriction endonuclease subunit S n=1 Tax=Arenibacter TaxID=178469 RepID=UPI000CD420FC|nr:MULTISPECIES: restriction endonuclease subunit S [Arenibacter]MCM4150019.1 restriction endonuclease subunit S [Arenibacter sp. N53]
MAVQNTNNTVIVMRNDDAIIPNQASLHDTKQSASLTPKLRFKEFEREARYNSYKKYIFNEIFLFATGKNIKQREAAPEFKIPCVRYGELYHMYNEVIYEIINRTNLDKSELHFSKGDEILLPSAGEDPLDIGSASALTIANVAIGRTINILKPKKDNIYSQIYASYYINEKLRKKISTLAKGSSISNVYNSDLKNLEIILPNLPEQQKIATFLSAVDQKINQLSKKKELLEQYKKGLMQRLFSGKLRFKDDEGKEYPVWEEKKLGEVMQIPKKVKPKNFDINKLLTVKLHTKGLFKNNNTESLKLGATIYFVRKKGQFIYGKQNLFNGAFGIIPDKFDGFCSSGDIPSIEFKQKKVIPKFVLLFLSRKNYYSKLENIASGSGSKRIHENTFLEVEINFPCIEEQQKISNYLSAIDTKIESVNQQITQTQTFKKGLLQQMFV